MRYTKYRAEPKPKKGFLDGYKTYEPRVEGYGSPSEWIGSFYQRMGWEEAKKCVKDEDPYTILGVAPGCSKEEIKNQFRKLMKQYHPDVCKDADATEKSQRIIAAYTLLTE